MKVDLFRLASATTVGLMLSKAVAPTWLPFLPFGGGPLEQFAIIIGGALVLKESVQSFYRV